VNKNKFFEEYCRENIIVNFEGDLHVFTEGVAFTSSSSTFRNGDKKYIKTETDIGADIAIINEQSGLEVMQHYEIFGEVICQYNEIKNLNDDEKMLINATSAMFAVPYKGLIPWNDDRRFRLHICKAAWSAEAQWHSGSLVDFGLNPMRFLENGIQGPGKITISSKGSWSTGAYYPIVILEDLENGETYFMEHEGGVSWKINIGFEGDALVFDCTSADIHLDGFSKNLEKDDIFTTTRAIYGKVRGGFDEAVAELTRYKRAVSKRKWNNGIPLVCYNVFMGAIYGIPNENNLKRLIPAAAKIGCEVFCIDSGWYRERTVGANQKMFQMGDYTPCDHLFGDGGLEGIIKMISDYGMIPGLWFEFEAAGAGSAAARLNPDTMYKRNGKVISADRGFFDLTNPEIREHLFNEVDRVYKMGVRYIKNDYNYSTGIGVGSPTADYNANERIRDKAICDFIDELYVRYPDMIIENCGSGGMREDNGTLSHYHLQSTSDQELYYNYASIAAASNAIMPPEKAGNWANPYFLREDEYIEFDDGENTDYLIERNLDGEATVFSMINGMVGVPLISGRIDYFDELNFALAKEAVECYKEMRKDIPVSYAVYPTGTELMGNRSYVTAGLINEEKTHMYLAVWKVNARDDEVMIDLAKYISGKADVKMIYPKNDDKCSFKYSDALKKLTVKMDKSKYMARLFEIKMSRKRGKA